MNYSISVFILYREELQSLLQSEIYQQGFGYFSASYILREVYIVAQLYLLLLMLSLQLCLLAL